MPSQILGIGDWGVGGIEVSIGKLAIYTAAGGVDPTRVIPVMLDVGTNRESLLEDPTYLLIVCQHAAMVCRSMTDYLPREITRRLVQGLRQLPVLVLSGLRQAGKSTLLQNEAGLAQGHDYRTLDDFATLAAARSNPESLLEGAAILDEVQRCPELLVALKKSADERRQPGRFILSGSANLPLLEHVTETLAGRAGYFTLHPLTRREQRRATTPTPFLVKFLQSPFVPTGKAEPVSEAEVLRGGLPPACLGPAEGVAEWFRGYVQTYVERDVRQLSQITDLVAFRTLAQLAALRTAQVLVISTLARDAKLNAVTAGRYLDLLETSFLIRRLPPFLKNRSSRLVKSPRTKSPRTDRPGSNRCSYW